MLPALSLELKQAQQIAGAAQAFALIALVVIVTTIMLDGGGPVGVAFFNNVLVWREKANRIGLRVVALAGDFAIKAIVAVSLIAPNVTMWMSRGGGFDIALEPETIGMLAFACFVAAVGRILTAATQLKADNDAFI